MVDTRDDKFPRCQFRKRAIYYLVVGFNTSARLLIVATNGVVLRHLKLDITTVCELVLKLLSTRPGMLTRWITLHIVMIIGMINPTILSI